MEYIRNGLAWFSFKKTTWKLGIGGLSLYTLGQLKAF